jgi:hypothetical protein
MHQEKFKAINRGWAGGLGAAGQEQGSGTDSDH